MFNLYSYEWMCSECKAKVDFVKIGVTSFGELCVRWCCPACQKDIMVRVPLANIIGDIPAQPLTPAEFTPADLDLMRGMHISLGGDMNNN